MESLNAIFINEGLPQAERLRRLNAVAIQQMSVLEGNETNRTLLKNLIGRSKCRCLGSQKPAKE